MDIALAAKMIQSTCASLAELRSDDAFSSLLTSSRDIAENEGISTAFEIKRIRRIKKMPGETAADQPEVNAEIKFKTQVYFAIHDRLQQEFSERFSDLNETVETFSCLYPRHVVETNIEKFTRLASKYSKDVSVDLAISEYRQFSHLIKDTQELSTELVSAGSSLQDLFTFLKKFDLDAAYPNLCVLYRILGTISVSSAGAERSFSRLKLIKSYLRSTMGEERLSGLALISIERQYAERIDHDAIISRFSAMKKRKMTLS